MDIVSRPYVDADAAELAELFNVVDVAVGMDATFTEAAARAVMSGQVPDYEVGTRMLFAPDGRLIANATVPPPAGGGTKTHIFGAVHPDHRGRGLGRELFAWQMETIRELRRETSPDGTWLVTATCDTRDTASIHLYIRYGLRPVRYYSNMVVDLDQVALARIETFTVADAMRTVEYTPDLIDAVHAAHMETFADHWGFAARDRDEWAPLAVLAEDFRPDLSLIAFDGPDIAAYVLVYDELDPTDLYVRSVGTRRPWRGRGHATALLAHVLRNAAAAGRTKVKLDVDTENPTGALGVYERLGFTVASAEVAYGIEV